MTSAIDDVNAQLKGQAQDFRKGTVGKECRGHPMRSVVCRNCTQGESRVPRMCPNPAGKEKGRNRPRQSCLCSRFGGVVFRRPAGLYAMMVSATNAMKSASYI